MDTKALSEARARAQDALSRERLANNPEEKHEWKKLAEEWNTRVADLRAKARKRVSPSAHR